MKKSTFDLTTLQTNARNPQITTPERLERLRHSLAGLHEMICLQYFFLSETKRKNLYEPISKILNG